MTEHNEQFLIRAEKREEMIREGVCPYLDRFERTHTLKEAETLADGSGPVKLAGRLISFRSFGKLIFGHIQDLEGKLQIAIEKKTIGEERFALLKKWVDIGDFLGCCGQIITTRTGEKTLAVNDYAVLSKTLRPLPEKWHGLTDIETRYRQRYLDLIMDRPGGQRFFVRAELLKLLRRYLEAHNFIEVDTPILQTKPSGALAVPFVTHHRALDMNCYLRIAPETYLKRCIAAGFDRVYELGRCFRNEGMDPSHLQDFTMLEFYAAYWNFEDNMRFTEALVKDLVQKLNGSLCLDYRGKTIDFGGEWPRVSLRELLIKDCAVDIDQHPTADSLRQALKDKGIELEDMHKAGRGKIIDQLYKKVSRPGIVNPLFLIFHPIDLSPLARRNDRDTQITDRFQLVINGWEMVNAYSELIDPIDQRQRFEEQARQKAGGDEEALSMDEDFLLCMEHGLPPVSGWGMGIDRMVCLLTGQDNLRETVLFPLMKPIIESEASI
ncbi:lysine--tRNA ligase [bacterium]|nr:lysine--tRNA ligase [bacterium]